MTSQCPPVDRLFVVPRRETLANIIESYKWNQEPSTSPKSAGGVAGGLLAFSTKGGSGMKLLRDKIDERTDNKSSESVTSSSSTGDVFSKYILGMDASDGDKAYSILLTINDCTDLPGKSAKEGTIIMPVAVVPYY
jgi:hypothetical protein